MFVLAFSTWLTLLLGGALMVAVVLCQTALRSQGK
jgi:hypothetical protein